MRKILIGISETATPKLRNYADAFTDLGAQVEILDWRLPRDPVADAQLCDAIVLCGGDDIEASYFGEENHPSVVLDPPERDAYELILAREAVQRGVPLLAVCRGVQVLNVALGGTVDQHIPATPGRLEHRGGEIHEVTIAPDSLLADILQSVRPRAVERSVESVASVSGERDAGDRDAGDRQAADRGVAEPAPRGEIVRVNSFHHQAVGIVAPGLRATALTADGVVEAIERTHGDEAAQRSFCLGVQWHPERPEGDPELRLPIFAALFEAAARRPAENRRESGTSGPVRPS